ncbi:PIN domain nuclease [Wenzhouxiangella sp. AB-CW3]|uniref:type II toxin-antitoxin system VapC family toxin n=1 Tax=Wenzhouxiangella sp. AB-CW3 TaxID=2771012 RepID=UPI00168BD0D5|nr:PIN domain nuclease [Wenzhouxiangella sp. AB-CW3]QOC23751.1 PIN domain nuclease [Wenzhouxiangella sp. AB-CW3]
MILVDTSVWIDYLRGQDTAATRLLESLLGDDLPVAITGVIYQEILQGADSPESFQRLTEYFGTQRFLHPQDPVLSHNRAADLYLQCRRAGLTIRSTIDCLIAQIAIEHNARLLQDDRDFLHLQRVIPDLQLMVPGQVR